jgi:hypothetical protein
MQEADSGMFPAIAIMRSGAAFAPAPDLLKCSGKGALKSGVKVSLAGSPAIDLQSA